MENYILEDKKNETPDIHLDYESHQLVFRGESWPEDTRGMYEPTLAWMDSYQRYLEHLKEGEKPGKVLCTFEFSYLNSATSVVVREILEKLIHINEVVGGKVQINWNYIAMDEDIFNLGKELEAYTGLHFSFNALN